jgi:hypothetical protein
MQDILTMLTRLSRPRLLIRAARIGAEDYRRDRHLQRVLGYGHLPRSAPALLKLMEIEAGLNQQRQDEDETYSLVRHVDVLIAMMGEARVLRASQLQCSTPT